MEGKEIQKIREGVKVTVEDKKDKRVKELNFILNTSQSGYASYITNNINGELDTLILNCHGKVSISITLNKYPNVILFKHVSLEGIHFIPIRLSAISPDYKVFNYSQEKWCLNDKLKCEIKGQKNSQVDFIVRYT